MLLREDKEHNARILVEQIIREDYTLEAYDLLKQYTEMLLARFNVVVTEEELKPEIADAVCALVYSGWLMGSEISELKALFGLFTLKYGKVYTQEVLDHKEKYINARLLKILSSTQVPDPSVVDAYLTEIAKAYGVEYIPKPLASVQPVSATLGIALPTPGMPMPAPGAPPGAPPAPMEMTASSLASAPPEQQKQLLGERLFPLISAVEPGLAGKITGMLLEMDNGELLNLLESPDALNAKIQEAISVLQMHNQTEGEGKAE